MPSIPWTTVPDEDDPDCAELYVDGTIAGRPYRFLLDSGAVRSQVVADEFTAGLAVSARDTSTGVFASAEDEVVTIPDLIIGPLAARELPVKRADAAGPRPINILGMDVLGRYRCRYDYGAAELVVECSGAGRPGGGDGDRDGEADGAQSGEPLAMDDRGHSYVDVNWSGASAFACWDSGAGITIVHEAFFRAHPELFSGRDSSVGTDTTGGQAETPTYLMAGPEIGGAVFRPHRVAVVDLSVANASLPRPMDMIIGFTTQCQADWLFDYPARRWSLLRAPILIP